MTSLAWATGASLWGLSGTGAGASRSWGMRPSGRPATRGTARGEGLSEGGGARHVARPLQTSPPHYSMAFGKLMRLKSSARVRGSVSNTPITLLVVVDAPTYDEREQGGGGRGRDGKALDYKKRSWCAPSLWYSDRVPLLRLRVASLTVRLCRTPVACATPHGGGSSASLSGMSSQALRSTQSTTAPSLLLSLSLCPSLPPSLPDHEE